jgi:hypothetical protein
MPTSKTQNALYASQSLHATRIPAALPLSLLTKKKTVPGPMATILTAPRTILFVTGGIVSPIVSKTQHLQFDFSTELRRGWLVSPVSACTETRLRRSLFHRSLNKSAYLPCSSFGTTSDTSPNFVFSGSVLSTATMRNRSGLPALSS